MVVNAYSIDTKWFRPFMDYPVCLGTRPAFYKPGQPGNPMAWAGFVYVGHDFDDFYDSFSKFGTVMKDPSVRNWQKRWSVRPGSRTETT